jgi:hypothetical protein
MPHPAAHESSHMRKLILALLFPLPAYAACDGTTLVSCTIKGTNQLQVCLNGDDLTYAYGPIGRAPDLMLTEPLANGTYTPWNGFGRSIWESITFTNAEYTYEVFSSYDRLDENAMTENGVSILKNGALVTTLTCDPALGMTIFDTLHDQMGARGYCWNRDTFAWARACPE